MPVARPLSAEEEGELNQLFSAALGLLPVGEQSDPHFLIAAMQLLIEEVRAGRGPDLSAADLATQLGVVWGDELCRVAGWQWRYLTLDNGLEGVAVISEDRAFVALPIHFLHRLLTRADAENHCLSRFQQILARQLGTPVPGRFRIVA
ncbi:MAG: hypothetical protein AAFV53_09615 [Myxococcota bacterium]